MTSIYSNNYYNDNDWGFYVDMDDIPAPIYIISHPLPKRYTPITKPPSFTILEEEVIIRPKNNINNLSRSFYSLDIIRNPVTKIATVLSMLIISISSLLFNIEIINDNEYN